ncbi:MAG: hypothetical protein IT423_21520 [Pirellulaceae bacterium]|nr:hypothetical protein [Pirellulaceae bacterium]
MRRVAHDLGGLAQRLNLLAEQLDEEVQTTQEIWKDQRGEAFLREHLSPFKPTVSQLVASIQEAHDLFEQLSRQMADPDRT